MDDDAFVDLVGRARRGEEVAIRHLLEEFEPDVRTMVRVRLPRALRSQFDSMDFVQAVWKSFFGGDTAGPGPYASPDQLRAYLAGIARNKVLEEFRRRTRTRKYDIAREEPLYVRKGGSERPIDVASRDPSPSQHLQARDLRDRLVSGRKPAEAEVVRLRQEGLTYDEIARRIGLGERTVRRVIDDLRRREEQRS